MSQPTPSDSLPILSRKSEILAALQSHPVLILAGETGSGKTTQLPQMALEAGLGLRGQIGCTQPRRVAALSVSKRVAEELGATWGREVGCKMRFQDATHSETRIKFMTDGILLAEIQSDPLLRRYSALILDEAHERSLNIDFLLGHLKTLVTKRRDLKLIITSATLDTQVFSEAFGGAPVLEVSGRMWPVEIRYAPPESWEDPELAADESDLPLHVTAAVRATRQVLAESSDGDVLVFMPTERDIRETVDQLEAQLPSRVECLSLFGRMPAADQQRIFSPDQRRRVIVATNVAETSLTLPRIRTVIDTGLARLSRYNPRTRTKRLPVEEIAQSNANQRAGRAGRVQAGLCIRLYTEENFLQRPRFTPPEIQRANLAEVILRMKAFGLGEIETFPFLNPPLPTAIRSGYRLLEELGALDSQLKLTPRGRELARLPLDPTLGRILLQAKSEGVLPEALVVTSALSLQDPRERPEESRQAAEDAHRQFVHPESDFLSLIQLWRSSPLSTAKTSANALRRFCKAHFLSFPRMREWRDLHDQLAQSFRDFLPESPRPAEPQSPSAGASPALAHRAAAARNKPARPPRAPEPDPVVLALHRCILSGFPSQLALRQERNLYKAAGGRQVHLFPGSALYERLPKKASKGTGANAPKTRQPEWIVGVEVVETSRLFIRTVGAIRPDWLLQIAPHLCEFRHQAPAWSPRAGRVLVSERVLVQGLEIARRPVDFGKIDPVQAKELFIRGALVPGELELPHAFYQANRELRQRLETALTRVRSGQLLDLDEAFYRFYSERLPSISSLHDLNRVLKERLPSEPDFCVASEADLLHTPPPEFDPALFPNELNLENAVLPISYAFAPGEEQDGVTVQIPLPLLSQLSQAQLQWMVPGLREPQAQLLLRALPKALRKSLHPLEPKAEEIAREFEPGRGEFLPALADFLTRKYRIHVRASDWPKIQLPDHLSPRAEVVDRRNEPVATGRQIHSLQSALAQQSSGPSKAFQLLARRWEKDGLMDWTFGDLPETLLVETLAGVPIHAYPGLERAGESSCRIRLFNDRNEAERASDVAVLQLAQIRLREPLARLRKEWGQLSQNLIPRPGSSGANPSGKKGVGLHNLEVALAVAARPALTPETLATDALNSLLRHSLRLSPVFPLHRERFERLLTDAQTQWSAQIRQLAAWLRELFSLRQSLEQSAKPHLELKADLARLMPNHFLESTPFERLPDVVRYLKAVRIRGERAALNPAKDAERARQLAPYRDWEKRVPVHRQEAFRWLLEEYRVSLFAQELGTSQPVSPVRLNAFGEL
jgi:ATP-dependent helicase HrpA